MIYNIDYKINNLLDEYLSAFDEETGELLIEETEFKQIEKELFELQNKKEDLKTWLLQKRANTIAQKTAIENEIKRLSELKDSINIQLNKQEKNLQILFKEVLQNTKKVIFDNFQIWFRKSSIIVLDEWFKDTRYLKEKITVTPDKNLIKEDLKNWVEIQGARIEEKQNFFIN